MLRLFYYSDWILSLYKFVSAFLWKINKYVRKSSEVYFNLQWSNSINILDFCDSQNLYKVQFIPVKIRSGFVSITQLTEEHWSSIKCFYFLIDLMLSLQVLRLLNSIFFCRTVEKTVELNDNSLTVRELWRTRGERHKWPWQSWKDEHYLKSESCLQVLLECLVVLQMFYTSGKREK